MKYSFDFLHHELMQYRSLNHEQYKFTTEVDLLQSLLKHEDITDYHEVEWDAFIDNLIGELPQPTRREIAKDFSLEFAPKTKLEAFVNNIIPRDEKVRVLTFLRDNCKQCLFDHPYYFYHVQDDKEKAELINFFEDDCARLISKNIEESQRDRFHGDFAIWPRPNLRQIALGEKPRPQLTAEEKIIIAAIPTYPGDKNAISKEDILAEAKEQVRLFGDRVARYNLDKQEKDKPCMSQKNYVEPIWNNLQKRANRYLYFDKNPAYQVLWVMCVLMRLPNKKHDWWTEKFADAIPVYLDTTQYFNGYKAKIDATIQKVVALSQPQLDLDVEPIQQSSPQQPIVNAPAQPVAKKKEIRTYIHSTDPNIIQQIEQDLAVALQQKNPAATMVDVFIKHKENMQYHLKTYGQIFNALTTDFSSLPFPKDVFRRAWQRKLKKN